ncbi:6-phosphogluconolactonase [Paenibacillus sp. CAA11]|uniref:lactonase family protein n=1 Tax=Paenibacillus sp. CAA11 TaxID=1532905 RepID=UPI000D3D381A|nr:lactonase family protein [Paenibacillus sp. CAA11]AWB43211.1 6-phosphogluconolactonase [Paenibacillus sp. CAA11]
MVNRQTEGEQLFYIGSYTEADAPGIHLASVKIDSGEMTILHSLSGLDNPSFLTVHPALPVLYAVTETDEGEAVSFRIELDGTLKESSREQTGGAHPCHAALAGEKLLVTVNYSGGQINSFQLEQDGAIARTASRVQHLGKGLREDRQEQAHPHSAIPDQAGNFVYVSDLGLDRIVVYRLQEGRLVTHQEVELPPGAGPRHFVIHPSKPWAYGVNELNNTVTAYAYHEREGNLSILQHISTLPENWMAENTAGDIHISSCGRFLYASNRGADTIVRYLIDPERGQLSEPQWTDTGGKIPRNFMILEGQLLVASQNSDEIAAFLIDQTGGTLRDTGHRLKVSKPVCLVPYK